MLKTIPVFALLMLPAWLSAQHIDRKKVLREAENQLNVLLQETKQLRHDQLIFPRTVKNDSLKLVSSDDWTSGFFPGILWMMSEASGHKQWKNEAKDFTDLMAREPFNGNSHDVGFKVYNSYGRGYQVTKDASYKQAIIDGARTLSRRFNPKTGCIKSWDFTKWQFPVIIDNMMNLELLFEATRLSGDSSFYKIAIAHATLPCAIISVTTTAPTM
jgi:unsaturated chondroitin disaccharide hydrolase